MKPSKQKLIDNFMQEGNSLIPQKKSNKSDKKDENVIYTSFLETPDYILEQIRVATDATHATLRECTEKYKYIQYSRLNGKIDILNNFIFNGKEYYPRVNKMTDKKVIGIPTGVEEYGTTSELIKDIKDFMFYYFEPPKFYEKFLPYYVLFTWVYDKFPFVAYLHFIGLSGTGKTVAAETISSICYKSIDAGGTTMSSMFRLADEWRGTMFIDEFEPNSFGTEYSTILSFLKTGVSDRIFLRTEGEGKKEVSAFIVKSPKIFTSENPINNAGFQSRSFIVKMEKKKRKLPLYKLNNYYKKIDSLRNKLLLWRLNHLDKINFEEVEYGFPELEPFEGRVQQVLTPIYLLADEPTRKEIIEFAQEQQSETVKERQDSVEGQIFTYISDNPSNPTIAEIVEYVNKGEAITRHISEKRCGNIIRKILRFEIDRLGHDNVRTVIVDQNRLSELREYYGLHILQESQESHESQNSKKFDENIEEIFGTTG